MAASNPRGFRTAAKNKKGAETMKWKLLVAVATVATFVSASVRAEDAKKAEEVTVKGEVLDMACYLDHGAHGEKHKGCAETCIESGLPVGIKAEDGTVYLLVGEHKPMNKELAKHAAETITGKGTTVSRDGINMIENAEIVP